MWNSLECYARDLHFGRGAGGEKERAFPICNPPFPEKEERERKGVFYFRRVTRDHFVERREGGGKRARRRRGSPFGVVGRQQKRINPGK